MKVILSNYLRIQKSSSKEETLDEIRDRLTFKNPDYHREKALVEAGAVGRYTLPEKYIKCFVDTNDELLVPRGIGKQLREWAKELGELYFVVDQRSDGHAIDFHLPFRGSFREFEKYQTRIIDGAIEDKFGVYICITGGGKTITGMGLIDRLKRSTLILVDRKFLLKQWKSDIESMATGRYELTLYTGGVKKKKFSDITIATTQTLARMKEAEREKFMNHFGCVLVDEVHKASAPTFTSGVSIFNSRYVIGMSANDKRKDRKEFIYQKYIGPVRHRVDDAEVEEAGRIVPVKYQFVETGYSLDYNSIEQDITRLPVEMLSDENRNELIIRNVMQEVEEGWVPLVFSNRVIHCSYLAKEFKKRGLRVGLMVGKVDEKVRDMYKDMMLNGKLDLLVANPQIMDTGINIPPLSSAHVTHYTSNEVFLKQAPGRVRRTFGNKEFAKLTIYVDSIYTEEKNKRTMQMEKKPVETFINGYRKMRKIFKRYNYQELENKVMRLKF
jgi:superfamily II DNA or RNA helicase